MNNKFVIGTCLGLSSLALASSLFAGTVYLGGTVGYSGLNTPSGDAFSVNPDSGSTTYAEDSTSTDIGGFGGNIYAGYNFNDTWALELGYTTYGESDYKSQQSQYDSGDLEGTSNASLKYTTHTYDLFFRGNMAVTEKFGVFAKAGLSYVNQDVDYDNSDTDPSIPINSGDFTTPDAGTNTYTAIRPAGALGFNFNITPALATQLIFQGFLGSGDFDSDQDAIASGYLIGAGISYTFA